MGLVSASTGTETARYEYGPFAEPIRVSGPAARSNPFRFSTKRTCNSTDLVLYEYRAYSPSFGRWLSRDPVGEKGGFNLLGFVNNNPISRFDLLGLRPPARSPVQVPGGYDCCCCTLEKIKEGRDKLMQYYREAAKILDDAIAVGRLKLDPEADQPGEASCHDSNWAVLRYMQATPPCWICWIERRYPNWWTGMNENSIVCMSIAQKAGSCVESGRIVFDYFDVAYHRGNSNPPYIIQPGTSYEDYISHYKKNDPDWVDPVVSFDDCSRLGKPRPGDRRFLEVIMK